MKVVVLGAGGSLGRNVVDAAARAGHDVRAFVRQVRGDPLPGTVQVIEGNGRRQEDVTRALQGVDVAYFCVNPSFARWLEEFPPLLAVAVAAARETGARLIFPANVWIYGPGRPGQLVAETYPPSPTSRRGRLRAAMEQTLHDSGCRFCVVRLPEFYGPHVVSLTARVFRAALRRAWTLWPGPLGVEVEFVYMPDAAEALLQVGGGGRGRWRGLSCAGDSDHTARVHRGSLPGSGCPGPGTRGAIVRAETCRPRERDSPRGGRHRPRLGQADPSGWFQVCESIWSGSADLVR